MSISHGLLQVNPTIYYNLQVIKPFITLYHRLIQTFLTFEH